MRLLLAVGHPEIQRFVAKEDRVVISEIAHSTEELLEILNYSNADTLMVSRYLTGCQNHRLFIDRIKAVRPELRIIYLYGEADSETESFIRYLQSKNIKDCKIGTDISSLELRELLFGVKENSKASIKSLFSKKTKAHWYKELDRAVITIYSNASNGKSHFAWNLSVELARRGYKTTLLNLDRGYSANIYFGIEEVYFDLLDYFVSKGEYKSLYESCYKKGGLNIITGDLGNENQICNEAFQKLLYFIKSKSDVLIIDTYTGLADTTVQAIENSDIDFLIFDCDLMHFHMNKLMLENLEGSFIDHKTYAVINNCNPGSESYKYIYRQINKLPVQFKDIVPLSSCGSLGCDLMSTGSTPYETVKHNNGFYMDMNNIMSAINVRNIFNKGVTR